MKKTVWIFIFALLLLGTNIDSADAKTANKLDNLILSLMNEPIEKAVTAYYKDDTARVQYYGAKGNNVIDVDQSEKGHNLKAFHVVKVHIRAENNHKILGNDTLTFGVTPTAAPNLGTKIELLSYDHNANDKK